MDCLERDNNAEDQRGNPFFVFTWFPIKALCGKKKKMVCTNKEKQQNVKYANQNVINQG